MSPPKLPSLDDACGDHFTYRDLVECGETWNRLASERTEFDNTPRNPGTYTALQLLCEHVLDPVARHFGRERLTLTYGHASLRLQHEILRTTKRIAPRLDQHAGWETRAGIAICRRLGHAADFSVAGLDSESLVTWLAAHTHFDRIYFYGAHRPVHCSASTLPAHAIWAISRGRPPRPFCTS